MWERESGVFIRHFPISWLSSISLFDGMWCFIFMWFLTQRVCDMTMQWDFYVQFHKSSAIINGWIKANEWCAGISLKNLIKLRKFSPFRRLIKTKICQFDAAIQPHFCPINFSKFLFRNFHNCCCSQNTSKNFLYIAQKHSKIYYILHAHTYVT